MKQALALALAALATPTPTLAQDAPEPPTPASVVAAAPAAPLGQIGFADFKRDMAPSIEGLPEMGWIFAPHAQRHGYAGEAAAAALAWADAALAADEIVAIIDPANAASIRLAERCGFAAREAARYRGETILLLRRRRGAG